MVEEPVSSPSISSEGESHLVPPQLRTDEECRSNCAFCNYTSEAHLFHAIQVSNGLLLRPGDPRCKPLVCRVRMHEDDVKSGVGAQRGGGLHKAYVLAFGKDVKLGKSEGDSGSSETGSSGSTTSSMFARNFPKVGPMLYSEKKY